MAHTESMRHARQGGQKYKNLSQNRKRKVSSLLYIYVCE